jgi:KDO2-lipid IV(A) lauroyltransferase
MGHALEHILFVLLRRVVLWLPLRGVQRVGSALGSVAYLLWRSRRSITLDNLAKAFPEKSPDERHRIALGAFRNYGISIAEFLWFPNLDDAALQRLVHVTNREVLDRAVAKGKGLIYLSGHFGNWELAAFIMSAMCGYPMKIIVRTQSNTKVNAIVSRHRTLRGNMVIPAGISVREIIKALDGRGIVAMAPDQSGPREGPRVLYFGRRVPTHQGPAVFALRSGTPMVMGFMIRKEDGTYDAVFEDVDGEHLGTSEAENIVEMTQRFTRLLEGYVRRYPDHWLWMHRRWKHSEAIDREIAVPADV